jgi:hypothetical protein
MSWHIAAKLNGAALTAFALSVGLATQASHAQQADSQQQMPTANTPSIPPTAVPAPNRSNFQSNTPNGQGNRGPGRRSTSIDLLTDPARDRQFETPMPTFAFSGPVICRPPVTQYPTWVQPYGDRYWPVDVTTGSGLSVGGSYVGQHWNVQFELGSGTPTEIVHRHCDRAVTPPVCRYPLFGWTYPSGAYWGSNLGWAYGPNSYGQDPRLWVSNPQMIAPAQVTAPSANVASSPATPPQPLRPMELARLAIASGQPKVAIEAIRREIKEQGETTETLRLMAVAFAIDRRWNDASALMRSAYRLDTKLGASPLELVGLGFNAQSWRELVSRSVSNANRGKAASDWLLVAALMQAEGRDDLAKKMVERSLKTGLEPEIAAGFPSVP